jgi:hypothetical protein
MSILEEKYFRVKELAERLNLWPDTICRKFKNERGTINLPSRVKAKRGKRPFHSPTNSSIGG